MRLLSVPLAKTSEQCRQSEPIQPRLAANNRHAAEHRSRVILYASNHPSVIARSSSCAIFRRPTSRRKQFIGRVCQRDAHSVTHIAAASPTIVRPKCTTASVPAASLISGWYRTPRIPGLPEVLRCGRLHGERRVARSLVDADRIDEPDGVVEVVLRVISEYQKISRSTTIHRSSTREED